ncbi:cell growth regulator with RING finger domain protein 1-like isoform X1 [Chrysoperla carnea]|uniref:cell growth regulator with RING finger domain protein 1-like isoform X1 n=1 Tax=Chrysoperla carnea TaxID=189513 RepID=UPI001D076C32|nr:cell growth regulator with RING finger domain protein 1-like isoform X1 [Chrysoperla carnea]
MVTMTTMLVSVAELSNIFSVFAVLLCFCVMILFITRNMLILRMNGEDIVFPTNIHPVSPRIPQMKMMKVHIPFTFKLLESSKSTYFDVQCTISSQVRYTIRAFWGVSIRELHVALWRPWGALRDAALADILLNGHFQQIGINEEHSPHGDRIITLSLPAKPSLQLGTPPRLAYPLVIFLMRVDHPDDLHPDETVALVNVVHIKDPVCTLPTSILAQYLKQANGQLSCLKQLYLATGNSTNYDEELQVATTVDPQAGLTLAEPMMPSSCDDDPTSSTSTTGSALLCTSNSMKSSSPNRSPLGVKNNNNNHNTNNNNHGPNIEDVTTNNSSNTVWNAAGEQLCVVCQYFPLSRALLPCRHTCICASCFGKLERCPMCRSPIKSYFCIRGEEYMPTSNNGLNGPTSPKGLEPGSPLFNWFDSWNDRITDFLGFGR